MCKTDATGAGDTVVSSVHRREWLLLFFPVSSLGLLCRHINSSTSLRLHPWRLGAYRRHQCNSFLVQAIISCSHQLSEQSILSRAPDLDFVVEVVVTSVVIVVGDVVGSGGGLEEGGRELKVSTLRKKSKNQQNFHVRCATRSTAVRRATRFTYNHIERYVYY